MSIGIGGWSNYQNCPVGEKVSKRYPVRPPVKIGEVYKENCRHCGGSGQEPGLTDLTCRECIGRGQRRWRIEECDNCQGKGKTGFFGLTKCKTCQGQGWKKRDVG